MFAENSISTNLECKGIPQLIIKRQTNWKIYKWFEKMFHKSEDTWIANKYMKKKVFNIISQQENANWNYNDVSFSTYTLEWLKFKGMTKPYTNKVLG